MLTEALPALISVAIVDGVPFISREILLVSYELTASLRFIVKEAVSSDIFTEESATTTEEISGGFRSKVKFVNVVD